MLIQGIAAIRALWIAPLLQASRPQSFSGHLSLPSFPTDVLFFPPPTDHSPNNQAPGLPVLLFPSGPEYLFITIHCTINPLTDLFAPESFFCMWVRNIPNAMTVVQSFATCVQLFDWWSTFPKYVPVCATAV
ncbi:hypothetical protein GOODEAATRI_025126 [Goodea atripinnis]|uniref:Secreted protein n=1 Tax=Goodea atripinnis TaxID=208336 RepID=A0ABV0PRQ1_9TELE